MMRISTDVPCVVVGLCGHGLGIARDLHRAGIRVVALEANPDLPGTRTRCAEVRIVPDINGDGLIDALRQVAKDLACDSPPVLLLTNDRMVATVGRHFDDIADHYRLSWGHAAERLVPLLDKDQIEARCLETELRYPRTVMLLDLSDSATALQGLRFPVIAKPTKPVSAFKTVIARSAAEFSAAHQRMAGSLPVIVQEFVPGDDAQIRFGAMYLDHGEVVARFEGQKLRSRPMGHTTLAISAADDRIHAMTRQFFDGLELSGPVSLEVKEDSEGNFWVIEPTVGRTDFWARLCVANGVDLSLVEYLAQTGNEIPALAQRDAWIWMNGERDPAAALWLLATRPSQFFGRGLCGLYASLSDPVPFAIALVRYLGMLPVRAVRKVWRVAQGRT